MIAVVVVLTIAIFSLAYRFYGRFLARQFALSDTNPCPPGSWRTRGLRPGQAPLLLAQHFSAIAGAGPIVGPILAGIWFGWLPALLWILFGAIFIGGIHDFSSLVASVRHKGASIGEIIKENMSHTSYLLSWRSSGCACNT